MMRTALTLLAALICWGIVLYNFRLLLQRRHRNPYGGLALRMWLVTVLIGLSLTLHVESVQVTVGRLTGFNNLAWYLAYLSGTTGYYFIGYLYAINLTPHTEMLHRWLWRMLLTVQVLLTLLYAVWIQHTAEWPARAPRSIVEIFFLVLFFGYGLWISALVLRSALRFFAQDRYPLARIRTLVGICMATLASLCSGLKIVYAFLVYRYPTLFSTVTPPLWATWNKWIAWVLVAWKPGHRKGCSSGEQPTSSRPGYSASYW